MTNKGKTKIVFMGGNILGCMCLRHLLRTKNIKVSLVVGCYNDNGSVIEPRVWNASIARLALNKMLPFIQPKSPGNLQFINDIQHMDQPDYIITVEYDKILNPTILSIPKIGSINIHFSDLPLHRGSSPVIWSVLENDKAGITMHWLNDKVNGGDIIASEKVKIDPDDTSFSVYSKLSKKGIDLFKSNFNKVLKGTAPRKSQDENQATYHAAGYPDQGIIDWNKPSKHIDKFIRALCFPGIKSARTFYDDMEVSILHPIEILNRNSFSKSDEPGTILDFTPDGILVKTGDGAVKIHKIRINQSMPIDAYKLGRLFNLKVGDHFRIFEKLKTDSRLNLIVP